MKKSFKYRIYSNIETIQKAEKCLNLCRQLYNNCLKERIIAYKERKESISVYQQMKNLPILERHSQNTNIFLLKHCKMSCNDLIKHIKISSVELKTAVKKQDFPDLRDTIDMIRSHLNKRVGNLMINILLLKISENSKLNFPVLLKGLLKL